MLQKVRDGAVIQPGSRGSFAKQVKERLQFISERLPAGGWQGTSPSKAKSSCVLAYMCVGIYKVLFIYLCENLPVRSRENNEAGVSLSATPQPCDQRENQYCRHLFSHILSRCMYLDKTESSVREEVLQNVFKERGTLLAGMLSEGRGGGVESGHTNKYLHGYCIIHIIQKEARIALRPRLILASAEILCAVTYCILLPL